MFGIAGLVHTDASQRVELTQVMRQFDQLAGRSRDAHDPSVGAADQRAVLEAT